MGPEPMTRMLSMSVRLGTGHQLTKAVEQIPRVVWAGGGLGVVLHAERGNVDAPQAFQRPVVEIPVRERDCAGGRIDDSGGGGRPSVAHLRSPVFVRAGLLGSLRSRSSGAPTAREAVRRDCEAVVVARDLHDAGVGVEDRLVRASVAEF